VAPAAHNFIVNFMSNHTAENPNGYLDKAQLKTFYSITGPDNALVWTPGQERIPQNWYRRPSSNPYDIKSALGDILVNAAQNPSTIQIGGNTGTVNSFVGIDLGDLTGGTYNAQNLLEGNNLACFAFQAASAGLIDTIDGILGDVLDGVLADVNELLGDYLTPILTSLECPQLAQYNKALFSQFPGYGYSPTAPARKS